MQSFRKQARKCKKKTTGKLSNHNKPIEVTAKQHRRTCKTTRKKQKQNAISAHRKASPGKIRKSASHRKIKGDQRKTIERNKYP